MLLSPARSLVSTLPALPRRSSTCSSALRSSMPSLSCHAARSVHTAGRPRVLVMDPIQLAHSAEAALADKYDLVKLESRTRDEFVDDCRGKYRDVRAIYRHFKGASTKVTGLFDRELVDALPAPLEFICHNGAGYDQIDIPSCTSRRIQVSNVPVAVDDATADTALFLLLGALRQFGPAQCSLYAGTFNAGLPLSNDPNGKLVGIVGMGGIGRAFARRVKSLGMSVQYHNRNRLTPDLEAGATYVDSLQELLETSDVVSLNLPLNAQTKRLMGEKEFGLMKKSAILINTARGGVVDESALVNALERGEIAGCGLDVYEDEPKIHEGLIKSDKAFLLPHVGTLTVETQAEMEAVCLRNIDQGLETGKLGFTVAEQKGAF